MIQQIVPKLCQCETVNFTNNLLVLINNTFIFVQHALQFDLALIFFVLMTSVLIIITLIDPTGQLQTHYCKCITYLWLTFPTNHVNVMMLVTLQGIPCNESINSQ